MCVLNLLGTGDSAAAALAINPFRFDKMLNNHLMKELRKIVGESQVMENRAGLQEDVDVEATLRKMRDRYQSKGFPVFTSAERALRGISHAAHRARFLDRSSN